VDDRGLRKGLPPWRLQLARIDGHWDYRGGTWVWIEGYWDKETLPRCGVDSGALEGNTRGMEMDTGRPEVAATGGLNG
jgi:hypothetical protein